MLRRNMFDTGHCVGGSIAQSKSAGGRLPMDIRRWCASRGIGKECCHRAAQIGNRGPLNSIRHLLERKAYRDTPLGCCQRRRQLRLFLPTRKRHCCSGATTQQKSAEQCVSARFSRCTSLFVFSCNATKSRADDRSRRDVTSPHILKCFRRHAPSC